MITIWGHRRISIWDHRSISVWDHWSINVWDHWINIIWDHRVINWIRTIWHHRSISLDITTCFTRGRVSGARSVSDSRLHTSRAQDRQHNDQPSAEEEGPHAHDGGRETAGKPRDRICRMHTLRPRAIGDIGLRLHPQANSKLPLLAGWRAHRHSGPRNRH